jgi:DNA-binding response OmpR family regulator
MELRELGDILVAARALSAADVSACLAEVPVVGESVVRAKLQEHLLAHERAVCEVLASRSGAPVLVLSESTLDLTTVDLVPADVAADFGVLPVYLDGDVLTLAARKADNDVAERRLAAVTGRSVLLIAAVPDLFEATSTMARLLRAQGDRVFAGSASTSTDPCLALARPPSEPAPAADAVARALGEILAAALEGPPTSSSSSAASSSSSEVDDSSPSAPRTPTTSRKLGALKLKQVARPQPPTSDPALMADASSSEPRGVVELPPLPTGDGPRAVVVEDDAAIRTMLARVLTADGCVVEQAGDGRTALALMRRQRPDLVVLDAMLPEIHGFEICAAIKKSEHWSGIPVLMISAVFRGFENARTIQEVHGADAFIEKPFDLRHLRHVVADLLQRPHPDVPRAFAADAVAQAREKVAACLGAGDVSGVVDVARQWVDADPFDADAWLVLGKAYAHRSEGLLALNAFERAATYGRTSFSAQVALATTYETFGFVRRARATWVRAAGVAPDTATATKIRDALAAWRST